MNAIAKQKPGKGLEIFFNPEIDHPQVDMSWCFNEDTLKQLIADEVQGWTYHVLVVSTHETERGTFEHRKLFRNVSTGFGFFTFYKAGAHDVRAFLFKFKNARKEAWADTQKLVAKAGRPGTYQTNIDIDTSESVYSQEHFFPGDALHLVEMYGIDVEIPEEIFADEPPAWLKNWVYLWSKYGPEDQCDFRRRVIFAFTIQLVLFPIWELFKRLSIMVIGVLVFFWGRLSGFRIVGLAFRPQWRYVMPEGDVAELANRRYVPKIWRGFPGRFMGPIALLIYGVLMYAGYQNREAIGGISEVYGDLVLTGVLWFGGIIMIGISLIFLLGWLNKPLGKMISKIINFFSTRITKWNNDRWEEKREHQRAKARSAEKRKDALIKSRLEETRPYLACGTAPSFTLAQIESRPARKSVTLRFQALKRAVCKPFMN